MSLGEPGHVHKERSAADGDHENMGMKVLGELQGAGVKSRAFTVIPVQGKAGTAARTSRAKAVRNLKNFRLRCMAISLFLIRTYFFWEKIWRKRVWVSREICPMDDDALALHASQNTAQSGTLVLFEALNS
jgi:hypothetical protein